jgi:hypothetical protein
MSFKGKFYSSKTAAFSVDVLVIALCFVALADCLAYHQTGGTSQGVYTRPDGVELYCQTGRGAGGWTVIQRHWDNTVDFNTTWSDYKAGFGNLNANFWLGLDLIHELTSQAPTTLDVVILDINNRHVCYYGFFSVGNESSGYQLLIDGFVSTTTGPDALLGRNLTRFSTYDNDQDGNAAENHALTYQSGWWYNVDESQGSNPNTMQRYSGSVRMMWGPQSLPNGIELRIKRND